MYVQIHVLQFFGYRYFAILYTYKHMNICVQRLHHLPTIKTGIVKPHIIMIPQCLTGVWYRRDALEVNPLRKHRRSLTDGVLTCHHRERGKFPIVKISVV